FVFHPVKCPLVFGRSTFYPDGFVHCCNIPTTRPDLSVAHPETDTRPDKTPVKSSCENARRYHSSAHRELLSGEERQYFIIQRIGRCNRRFRRIQLGKRIFAVSIHEGLLIDTANTFHIAYVEGVLRAQVARMVRFYLTTDLLIQFLPLQRSNLIFSKNDSFRCDFGLQSFQAFPEVLQIMTEPD
ncbi:hypothetical protein BpHYR1_034041, partial [Brachionus plicatilis]